MTEPHLRGIGFDQPEAASVFEDYENTAGVENRVSFIPGSFFADDQPKANIVLMGHILHDWDLPTKKMLTETPVGFDFTGRDCAAWMREAGFSSTRVQHLFGTELDCRCG